MALANPINPREIPQYTTNPNQSAQPAIPGARVDRDADGLPTRAYFSSNLSELDELSRNLRLASDLLCQPKFSAGAAGPLNQFLCDILENYLDPIGDQVASLRYELDLRCYVLSTITNAPDADRYRREAVVFLLQIVADIVCLFVDPLLRQTQVALLQAKMDGYRLVVATITQGITTIPKVPFGNLPKSLPKLVKTAKKFQDLADIGSALQLVAKVARVVSRTFQLVNDLSALRSGIESKLNAAQST